MAKKIKRGFVRIISGLIKVLGISSLMTAFGCSYEFGDMYGMPPAPEYGVPTNVYVLEGTVTGAGGVPVQGIRVGVKKSADDEREYSEYDFKAYSSYEDEEGYEHRDVSEYFDYTETDADGKFRIEWDLFPDSNRKFLLYAEDIDGEENGSYSEKSMDIQFAESDRTKDGSWVDTYEIKNKNISLDSLK